MFEAIAAPVRTALGAHLAERLAAAWKAFLRFDGAERDENFGHPGVTDSNCDRAF